MPSFRYASLPRYAKSKDDHAFFNMNELCVLRRPFVDAVAATAPLRRRPKNLKLKLGDYLEYTPATGEPKNGAPGKPRATKVERAPRPKKVCARRPSLVFYF